MTAVSVCAPHRQVKSAEALAAELEAFLWPHGTKTQGQAGRAWESLEGATEEIKQFMQTQGCCGLKIKNQSYFDAARTKVKKRVFKCPCAGAYTPRAVQSIAVGRQTSTKKTNCGVYININVDAHSGEWLCRGEPVSASVALTRHALTCVFCS